MSENDEYAKQAAELLPCVWVVEHNSYQCKDGESKCIPCQARPAVAAKLREQGEEIAKLKAENERLVIEVANRAHFEKHAYIAGLEAAREAMRWCPGLDEVDCIKACGVLNTLIDAKKGEG